MIPQHGRILADGRDLRDLDLDAYRRQIGIVYQESFLFSNTVAANIAFGSPHATQAQIERAARTASAHEFIMGLPHGYETVLGESGVDLSGGQRQRLALARALLLEPPILILDDPTASVDPKTEHEIVSALRRPWTGRTTFVVANRLSLLRRADVILVLDKGRLAQMGTHDELVQVPGTYRETALLQLMDLRRARRKGSAPRCPQGVRMTNAEGMTKRSVEASKASDRVASASRGRAQHGPSTLRLQATATLPSSFVLHHSHSHWRGHSPFGMNAARRAKTWHRLPLRTRHRARGDHLLPAHGGPRGGPRAAQRPAHPAHVHLHPALRRAAQLAVHPDLRPRPAIARAGLDDRPDHQRPDRRAGPARHLSACTAIYLGLVLLMVVTLHFRQLFALELGEAVAHDMRLELFRKLTTLPMSFFNRTKFGRIISRMTSDIDSVRVAVQDVAFVVTIQAVQMTVAALLMAWYNWKLFSLMLLLVPGIWMVNQNYRREVSHQLRKLQETWSRLTSTLAESVGGIRVTQAFVRQEINAGLLPQAGEPARREQRGRGAGFGGVHSPAPDEEPAVPGRRGAAQRFRRAALARLAAHGSGRPGDVLLPGQLLL